MRTARAQAGEPDERPGAFLLLPAELASLPVIGTQFEAFTRRATGPRGESRQAHEMRLAVQEAAAKWPALRAAQPQIEQAIRQGGWAPHVYRRQGL